MRVLVWIWLTPLAPLIHDEQAHITLGTNLLVNGEYAFEPGKTTSLRPPLYPAFLAVIFGIFGVDNFHAVRIIQAFISLATVVLVFRSGRDLYSERAGLWAAAMMTFYPTFLGFNNLILSEVLFTFLLVSGVYALQRGMNRLSYRGLAVAGVLLGLGALTRSILYPLAPLLALFLLIAGRGSISRRMLAAAAFIVPFASILAPWSIRNTQLQQTFIVVDCMGGRNFMMGNYEHTPLYRSWDAISITGEREWFQTMTAKRPLPAGATQGVIDKLAFAEGVSFVRENPSLTAYRDLIKFLDFWGLERELIAGAHRGIYGQVPQSMVLLLGATVCGAYAMLLFAGVFGATLCPPTDWRMHILMQMLIAFTCAVHTVVFAHSRYHLPVIPFISLYAAGAVTTPGLLRSRRRTSFWLATGFCLLVVSGWVWSASAGDLPMFLSFFGVSE